MTGLSLLYDDLAAAGEPTRQPPAYFVDLNLDQVVAELTAGRADYDLESIYYTRLQDVAEVVYRHEVFADLHDPTLVEQLTAFAGGMTETRDRLAQSAALHHPYQRQAWLRDAADSYLAAVATLRRDLAGHEVGSRGLRRLRDYLADYTASARFTAVVHDARRVSELLSRVEYTLWITGNRIRVSRYDAETDYSAEIAATFAKFRQGATKDYAVRFSTWLEMNHVEADVLERVARLWPEAFGALTGFAEHHRDFIDPVVARVDRELQFYLAYLDFAARLGAAGLSFCYPRVSRQPDQVRAVGAFDVALAAKLVPERKPVVCNGFELRAPERLIVVTGPNQGGKTTFARMFGQLHHLAALGLPVPGQQADLGLCDALFTQFERGENLADLRGKLEDDLVRIHAVLEQATPRSIIVLNEIFTSTTVADAVFLGTRILARILEAGSVAVCVTFLDELAGLGPAVISMVAEVAPDDPRIRTRRVVRRPADGLAYTRVLAESHGLTYDAVKRRLAR